MPDRQAENHYGPQAVTPNCPRFMIVADDLTGACDAAVAFTSACDPVRVEVLNDPQRSSTVRAVTTESRELPAAESELRLRSIVERLPAGTELFKKIDSVFRGNTVTEIAATLRHARFELAILAPAYPALGRTVRQGVLHINDGAGERDVPIADLVSEAGCSFALLPAGRPAETLVASLEPCISRKSAVLCDAATQLDLTNIVHAARTLGRRTLWIGSGGLAHALAAELPARTMTLETHSRAGSTIFFIGSPHPVSHAQVDHLRRVARIAEHHPNARHASGDDLMVRVTLGETTPDEIRCAVVSHDPAQLGCLFMTGGDTAHFVCRALEIQSLRLLQEFAPGVPLAVAEGGPFDGVRVVLKSGSFGEPDLLCRLLEARRVAPEVIA